MTYLVTGGAGFIGSNFISYLAANRPGVRVVCYDALTYAGDRASLAALEGSENFRFVEGDIRDRAAVDAIFAEEDPEVVVNFAAQSHVERSVDEPELFFDTNVRGTLVLLEASLKHGVTHFHQVSTDEVYGELPLTGGDAVTEDSPLCPTSPYSVSKAAADLLTLEFAAKRGLYATISRSSNNYGPYQYPEKLVPLMITRALTGEPMPLYGDGENVRDWLYVTDHCRAIDAIIEDGKSGEVYNVCTCRGMRNSEVTRGICAAAGAPESLITAVPDRRINDKRYSCDASKIRRELGWEHTVGFEDGLAATVDWYRGNRGWWANKVK